MGEIDNRLEITIVSSREYKKISDKTPDNPILHNAKGTSAWQAMQNIVGSDGKPIFTQNDIWRINKQLKKAGQLGKSEIDLTDYVKKAGLGHKLAGLGSTSASTANTIETPKATTPEVPAEKARPQKAQPKKKQGRFGADSLDKLFNAAIVTRSDKAKRDVSVYDTNNDGFIDNDEKVAGIKEARAAARASKKADRFSGNEHVENAPDSINAYRDLAEVGFYNAFNGKKGEKLKAQRIEETENGLLSIQERNAKNDGKGCRVRNAMKGSRSILTDLSDKELRQIANAADDTKISLNGSKEEVVQVAQQPETVPQEQETVTKPEASAEIEQVQEPETVVSPKIDEQPAKKADAEVAQTPAFTGDDYTDLVQIYSRDMDKDKLRTFDKNNDGQIDKAESWALLKSQKGARVTGGENSAQDKTDAARLHEIEQENRLYYRKGSKVAEQRLTQIKNDKTSFDSYRQRLLNGMNNGRLENLMNKSDFTAIQLNEPATEQVQKPDVTTVSENPFVPVGTAQQDEVIAQTPATPAPLEMTISAEEEAEIAKSMANLTTSAPSADNEVETGISKPASNIEIPVVAPTLGENAKDEMGEQPPIVCVQGMPDGAIDVPAPKAEQANKQPEAVAEKTAAKPAEEAKSDKVATETAKVEPNKYKEFFDNFKFEVDWKNPLVGFGGHNYVTNKPHSEDVVAKAGAAEVTEQPAPKPEVAQTTEQPEQKTVAEQPAEQPKEQVPVGPQALTTEESVTFAEKIGRPWNILNDPSKITFAADTPEQTIEIKGKKYTVKNIANNGQNNELLYAYDANNMRPVFYGQGVEVTTPDGQDDSVQFEVQDGVLNTGSGNDNVFVRTATGATINLGDGKDSIYTNVEDIAINAKQDSINIAYKGQNVFYDDTAEKMVINGQTHEQRRQEKVQKAIDVVTEALLADGKVNINNVKQGIRELRQAAQGHAFVFGSGRTDNLTDGVYTSAMINEAWAKMAEGILEGDNTKFNTSFRQLQEAKYAGFPISPNALSEEAVDEFLTEKSEKVQGQVVAMLQRHGVKVADIMNSKAMETINKLVATGDFAAWTPENQEKLTAVANKAQEDMLQVMAWAKTPADVVNSEAFKKLQICAQFGNPVSFNSKRDPQNDIDETYVYSYLCAEGINSLYDELGKAIVADDKELINHNIGCLLNAVGAGYPISREPLSQELIEAYVGETQRYTNKLVLPILNGHELYNQQVRPHWYSSETVSADPSASAFRKAIYRVKNESDIARIDNELKKQGSSLEQAIKSIPQQYHKDMFRHLGQFSWVFQNIAKEKYGVTYKAN